MDKLINKARKDFQFRQNAPRTEDILTLRGFARYFMYRNSLPFVRDISYMIISLVQILVMLKMLGTGAAAGGVIGYAFVLFVTDFWDALKYSLREKILVSEQSSVNQEISKYFLALVMIGIVIWLVILVGALSLVKVGSTDGSIILISTMISIIFQLISSSYFMATYTISRVYMPMHYTLGSRILNLLIGIALIKVIGVYGICFSFFSSRIMDLLITKHYCDKTLRTRNITLIQKNIRFKEVYKSAVLLLTPISRSLKRLLVFTVVSADKLILIILVHHYYKSYVIDFFLMYQLINIFMLIPARISKSVYYDTVMLLKTRALSMLRLLFNRNLIVVIILGVIFAYLFSLVPTLNLPHRHWSSLILDLTIIDQWTWVYISIFCYFIIRFINRFFLFSEAYITLLIPYVFFEYLMMIYLLLGNKYFMETKEIIIFFAVKGQVGVYYFAALLLIYASGIWKKESAILNFGRAKSGTILKDYADFKNDLKDLKEDDRVIMLIFERSYTKNIFIEQALNSTVNNFNIISGMKISNNTSLLIHRSNGSTVERIKFKAIELFSVYCREIFVGTRQELLDAIASKEKQQTSSPYRSIINIIYPKLFSRYEDIEQDGMDLEQVQRALGDSGVTYSLYDVRADMGSSYLRNIIKNKSKTKLVFHFLRRFELKKYEYIDAEFSQASSVGIIPIITDGELKHFIDINDVSNCSDLVRKIVRNSLYRNLLTLLKV